MKGPHAREGIERAGQPRAHLARGNNAVELPREAAGAFTAELADAKVFGVAQVVVELLIDGAHKTLPDVHLHLLGRVRLAGAACARQQRVVESRFDQVCHELWVEEHVAVEHYERVFQHMPCQPEGIQAVRGSVARVRHDVHVGRTRPPDIRFTIAGDDGDRADAERLQRANLPLEKRAVADACEAFGPASHDAAQAPAASRREDDGLHAASGMVWAARRRRRASSATLSM
jgi:hypothetical protein